MAFTALTTIYERYAYPALVFPFMGLGSRSRLVAWVAFGVARALTLVVAVPPGDWEFCSHARSGSSWP